MAKRTPCYPCDGHMNVVDSISQTVDAIPSWNEIKRINFWCYSAKETKKSDNYSPFHKTLPKSGL